MQVTKYRLFGSNSFCFSNKTISIIQPNSTPCGTSISDRWSVFSSGTKRLHTYFASSRVATLRQLNRSPNLLKMWSFPDSCLRATMAWLQRFKMDSSNEGTGRSVSSKTPFRRWASLLMCKRVLSAFEDAFWFVVHKVLGEESTEENKYVD
jgi:hypothetical protein